MMLHKPIAKLFATTLIALLAGQSARAKTSVLKTSPTLRDSVCSRTKSGCETMNSDTLTLIFTGDILLDRGVRTFIRHRGTDKLFSREVATVLRSSNIVVGNLECPATRISSPVFKRFVFRAEPEWLSALRSNGFTHLNLANNHSIDQGRAALIDTRRNIIDAGMTPVGAGNSMSEAVQPALLSRIPREVYLFTSLQLALENYAYLTDKPCVSQEPLNTLAARIRQLRKTKPHAYIIVNLHWGIEHTLKPTPTQRSNARMLVDAGADIIVCHHTHTMQTVETYRNKSIYYSIGNFIFDQNKPINTRACMVRLKISSGGSSVETIPIEIRNCVPHIAPADK